MDAPTAFLAALAITTAGGAVTAFTVRAGVTMVRAQSTLGQEAWHRTHRQRREAYAEFGTIAARIATIVGLWTALPAAARPEQRDQARGYLRNLERQLGVVMLGGGRDVQTAAQQLVDQCTRLVHGLDVGAASSPAENATSALALPFLQACREYLDAESARHFGTAARRAPRLSSM
ncbi:MULTISPECIES: hypothetical protein [unclassified Streptomyces]|uniref:hypothetical protein n=1 Tax=unclassified Streptomyces TaxID=2593676 RepID=UPI001331AA2A|nr:MULTISPECIES: hypothetical protein [unclassified Streptomyces]MCP3771598.1 hypothetical protein [Streptomyces sp. MAR25Y5]